jgi:5-methylcytosine-specific restriction endonuclease McrA
MRLTTLKPRLATLNTSRAPTLTTETANPRPRGRSWQETRARIQVRDNSLCAACGRLWQASKDHVDHEIPREQGGSDDDSNLRLRCVECHKAKTAREAAQRAGRG